MPPRSGQLDEISQLLGRLEGKVDSLDQYTHEREHNVANLSGKIDGLSSQITREVARMKAELQVQLDAMDRRIAQLEATGQQQVGAKNLAIAFLHSPVIAWIFAIAVAVWTYFKGSGR